MNFVKYTSQLVIATSALTLSLGLIEVNPAQAASITWKTGGNFISNPSAIDTSGTIIEAINFGSNDQTVNAGGINVTFQNSVGAGKTQFGNPPLAGTFVTLSSLSGSSAPWDKVISQFVYDTDNTQLINNFLTGLTIGQQYQIELFAYDDRNTLGNNRNIVNQYFFDGNGNNSPTFTLGTGTSIVGTFTADATTQDIGFSANPDPVLNAYILSTVTSGGGTPPTSIPEPTILASLLIVSSRLFTSRKQK
ncbi:MAG: hypothetical protein D6822_00990 [Cyanobacteria bacterium J149]|nr:MAG: hypothetical protein D6822_00990 [Cyanobacteria bacterium J149]